MVPLQYTKAQLTLNQSFLPAIRLIDSVTYVHRNTAIHVKNKIITHALPASSPHTLIQILFNQIYTQAVLSSSPASGTYKKNKNIPTLCRDEIRHIKHMIWCGIRGQI